MKYYIVYKVTDSGSSVIMSKHKSKAWAYNSKEYYEMLYPGITFYVG
jgi:hypothetical protein